jgi:putative toxin-antitoxin system antitoxin component (TIGR02293 family)
MKMAESGLQSRFGRIVSLAQRVWEDDSAAEEFLRSPQPLLGGSVPLHLAESEAGRRKVEELLMRLEHSLPL